MQRITLHSKNSVGFSDESEGSYIKLLFNQAGGSDLSVLNDGERPVMRTYTVRRFDKKTQCIDVDFVRHITQDLQCGFAARWAMEVTVGDTINVAGPGTIQNIKSEADWFFMVADMTALPALSAKIRKLPASARGYAVIQVHSKQDMQPLEVPDGVQIKWITKYDELYETVRQVTWLSGEPYVWCACEFESMRQLRQYFRSEREVGRENIYISSYWKRGVTEDGHKVIKRQDAEHQA